MISNHICQPRWEKKKWFWSKYGTVCMPQFAYCSLGVYIDIPLSFKALGTTMMLPIRPVNNCLLNFRPTFTATTSFVSFEGFETSTITRNITLTLPLLKWWNRLQYVDIMFWKNTIYFLRPLLIISKRRIPFLSSKKYVHNSVLTRIR